MHMNRYPNRYLYIYTKAYPAEFRTCNLFEGLKYTPRAHGSTHKMVGAIVSRLLLPF